MDVYTAVRWPRWLASGVVAGLLALAVNDLIAFQFRDDSPYASTGVDGKPLGLKTPQYDNTGLLSMNLAAMACVTALFMLAIGILRRWPRLAALPVLASGAGVAIYAFISSNVNPLQAMRCRTDACVQETDGPGWYLPARNLMLIGLSVGAVALLVLGVMLLLRRRDAWSRTGTRV
ncbi:hypothetical protein [Nocardia lijiangensis]|uniref:hypothetical protein n=1 Tax=Nocardia lijiangensis TaxID=299618 RepID=UPI00082D0B5E|nr:hypothetical protein [Nocardia lijiangensis]